MRHSNLYKNQELENTKVQTQLRKIKNYLIAEKNLQKDKFKLQQIQKEIQNFQEKIKNKKKQVLYTKIEEIHKRNQQRKQINQITNEQVLFLRKMRQIHKQQMEYRLQKEREQYQKCYQKALAERHTMRKKIDFNVIKNHQRNYLGVNKKLKTENQEQKVILCSKSHSPQLKEKNHSLTLDHKKNSQSKKNYGLQLLKKSIQYGNKMQIEKRNSRLKTEVSKAINIQMQNQKKFKQMLKKENLLLKQRKPGLVVRGDWQKGSLYQIKKLKQLQTIQTFDKIQKLKFLSDGYRIKFQNGKFQNLNLLSEANLAKADLLLSIQNQNQE